MPEKKKNINKENYKPIKKNSFNLINYTEELRVPTLATV
jgi:hypothetical protein